MASKQRIEWLDIAKGIGILLVIVGHCIKLSSPLCQLIFVFHMPLFFLLAGYTASQKDGFFTTLGKKAKTLLLPFLGFFALGLLVTMWLPMWQGGLTAEGILSDLYFADPTNVHNSSIWFLVCLFFVVLVYFPMRRLPLVVQVLLIAGIYIAGIWYIRHRAEHPVFEQTRLPLNLDVVPLGLPFYSLGVYMRRFKLAEKMSKHILTEVLVTVLATVALLAVYKKNGYVNTHGLIVNDPTLFLLGGLCGTLAVIGISMLVARFRREIFLDTKRVLLWYGRNSLYVLGFQSLLIRLYCTLFNHYRHGQLGMYNFPWSHAINATIAVAFILVPLCVLSLNAVKRGGKRLKRKLSAAE